MGDVSCHQDVLAGHCNRSDQPVVPPAPFGEVESAVEDPGCFGTKPDDICVAKQFQRGPKGCKCRLDLVCPPSKRVFDGQSPPPENFASYNDRNPDAVSATD